jgi:hypothetical protein
MYTFCTYSLFCRHLVHGRNQTHHLIFCMYPCRGPSSVHYDTLFSIQYTEMIVVTYYDSDNFPLLRDICAVSLSKRITLTPARL